MTSHRDPAVRLNIDVANPGQFFACCGLLELADRIWPGTEGWFDGPSFCIDAEGSLAKLVGASANTPLAQLDTSDNMTSPIELAIGGGHLRLDWWKDGAGGKELKVWAGRMENVRIARAMQGAFARRALSHQ